MSKVLILATHTDDAELGCGGTISKLLREGNEVYCAVFSKALTFSKGGYLPREDENREWEAFNEFKLSMDELGVKGQNLFIYRFPTRYLYGERQDVLDKMIKIRNEINPDIVFLPGQNTLHQDHQVVSKEGIRAFKSKTILGYEYPWDTLNFTSNCFYILGKNDIEKKIRALSKYKSQKDRVYMTKDFIMNWAKINGVMAGSEYAEIFIIIREIR